jgi:hypothetical protein
MRGKPGGVHSGTVDEFHDLKVGYPTRAGVSPTVPIGVWGHSPWTNKFESCNITENAIRCRTSLVVVAGIGGSPDAPTALNP